MFNKPFRVKSNTQLKGSERKKIRAEILKSFPHLTEDSLQELLPTKETVTAMKIFTSTGDSLMVHFVQKLPIVFEVDQVLYPTVYMLWKFPNILPTFTTWPLVFPKLTGGADLMLPGVVVKEPVRITSYGKLKKGDRVAVNLTSNKAPVAVGQAALASDDMYMAARRGKAVKILHYVGDQLWSHGTKLPVPELGPPLGFEDIDYTSEDTLTTAVSNVHIGEGGGDANFPLEAVAPLKVSGEEEKEENEDEEKQNEAEEPEILEEEGVDPQVAMDHLLQYCFLKVWKTSAKKPDFPLLTSNFYKLHMIPACPTGLSLDVKKSSYKKLSQFLDHMAKENVLVVKELTKGVVSIMSVNWEHQMLKEFVDTLAEPQEAVTEHDIKPSGKPTISEMFEVTAAVLPVLSSFQLRKGTKVFPADLKKHVSEYIRSHNIQSTKTPSYVCIDETLARIVQSEVGSEMSREDVHSKFLNRMKRCYQIDYPSRSSAIQAKGKLEPIDIQVTKRAYNKKVTLIYNLELFGIDLHEFARECQHGVAASSSISSVAHRKGPQLLIQGNQVAFVGNLLTEKYKIPKRYIRGLEKAVKSKK